MTEFCFQGIILEVPFDVLTEATKRQVEAASKGAFETGAVLTGRYRLDGRVVASADPITWPFEADKATPGPIGVLATCHTPKIMPGVTRVAFERLHAMSACGENDLFLVFFEGDFQTLRRRSLSAYYLPHLNSKIFRMHTMRTVKG